MSAAHRKSSDLSRAKRLYQSFRETAPRRIGSVRINLPDAVAVIGRCSAIEYETTHGGTSHAYRHEFAPGSRALLCAGTSDGQLYLVRGRFRVTSRGIVDLDTKRRELP